MEEKRPLPLSDPTSPAPQAAPAPAPVPAQTECNPAAASATPATPAPPAGGRGAPMVEETYYDGPCSWWARVGNIASTLLLVVVLVGAAILVALWDWERAVRWRPWPTILLVVAAMIPPLLLYLRHKTTRYKLTNYRVDYERGVLTTRIDSMELWHIDDIRFSQPLLQRMTGVGTIELRSDDRTSPTLVLPALPHGRQLYETLKSRIIAAKRERGLLELDQ